MTSPAAICGAVCSACRSQNILTTAVQESYIRFYGRIREAENGRAQITCYQFQSSADPLKFFLLILVVMLGFSIGPIKNTVRDLAPHLKIALKIAVFFVIGDWLRCFVSRKMYGEDLPCSLDEFLCEIMNARLKGR